MNNFHSLEVEGRVGETQLQVGENLNYLILGFKMLSSSYLELSGLFSTNRIDLDRLVLSTVKVKEGLLGACDLCQGVITPSGAGIPPRPVHDIHD